ncbi:MAG TPA: NAD+ synthase [Bacteroidetes bacterium]|nr:NAD+ synthase [Bacteroidota bacterium]|tara:strand:- start:793 stop:2388 length:1596 start_codon:yes stop_codon:yes gene_type:complete
MNLRLLQINPIVGDVVGNLALIKKGWTEAPFDTDLVISPELAVCGYPPLDLLKEDSFVYSCMKAVELFAKENRHAPPLILGCPWILNNACYNAAILIEKGVVTDIFTKRALPNYDVFDEKRYFVEGHHNNVLTLGGRHLLITICEDIWVCSPKQLISKSLDNATSLSAVINLSASPYAKNQQAEREKAITNFAKEAKSLIVYCNQTGANTELIFDGKSGLYGESGPLSLTPAFTSCSLDVNTSTLEYNEQEKDPWEEEVLQALTLGMRDYFHKINLSRAILGLSGGIDSALVAYIACRAIGAENVLGVLMPSEFSSDHSVNDALALAQQLEMPTKTLSIQDCFTQTKESLKESQGVIQPITEENLQARLRGLLLMALANDEQRVLLNTSNKSETAVGYTTIYGDMCGGLSILGDVWKSEAYKLAQHINREKAVIPDNILSKPPSAELRPNQSDADELPDYSLLDPFLEEIIEGRKTLQSSTSTTLSKEEKEKVYGLIERAEWKRFQTPPILRISQKAFGGGRRIPIVKRRS